jgi:steroid 5-alpha reductase family enzyme
VGFVWETLADWQLSIFKASANNKGKVLSSGLWRYCRHPNYFGECCVWWGFYLIAVAAGAWWTLAAPLVMTLLLLKVSGVALLEKDIAERRPAYRDYIKSTNAFLPWLPKK